MLGNEFVNEAQLKLKVNKWLTNIFVQELLERLEAEVGEQVAYNDACSAFNAWLRAAREQLATCSDTYGDQPAIESKLSKINKMDDDLDEGQAKLDTAVELSEKILQHTSPAGHPRVQNDVHNMMQDFADLQVPTSLHFHICFLSITGFTGVLHFMKP